MMACIACCWPQQDRVFALATALDSITGESTPCKEEAWAWVHISAVLVVQWVLLCYLDLHASQRVPVTS